MSLKARIEKLEQGQPGDGTYMQTAAGVREAMAKLLRCHPSEIDLPDFAPRRVAPPTPEAMEKARAKLLKGLL